MFVLFFLFALLQLCADPKDPYSLAVREGEPATLVEGCVSAITGDLYLAETDAVVQGLRNGTISPETLPIEMIVRDGQKITLNNRSLLALRRAGIQPKVVIDKTGINECEALLNKHLKGNFPSDVIRIRGGPPGTSYIGPIE